MDMMTVHLTYLGAPSLPYAQEKNMHLYPLKGAEVLQGTQGTPLAIAAVLIVVTTLPNPRRS